jgi:hypothetical protein
VRIQEDVAMPTIPIRATVAALLLAAWLTSSAPGQSKPEDLLNRAKADQALLTQRLDSRMRDALAEARRLQPLSQARAVNALKTALLQLDDPLVPASFRSEWTVQLNAQVRLIEAGKKMAAPDEINPVKRQVREADVKRAKAAQDEYNEVKRSVDTIAALVRAGNTAQAQKEAEALAKRYPDNPAAITMTDSTSMNQRVADARFLVEQQKQGYLVAMRSVDKSAIPIKGDIEFDKERFREITKLRMKPALTKKEQQLMRALDEPITLGFKDAPFEEVLKSLSTQMGVNILVDKLAMNQAMIESSTPVSITLRDVTGRTALRKLLQDHQLTYIIKDETIQVVTIDKARETLVTRVYYLGDLLRGVGPLGGAAALQWGPWVDMLQTQDNANKIIEMIKTIDPDSWKERGGNGTIAFNLPSMSIIVRQTAEVHARLGASLGSVR